MEPIADRRGFRQRAAALIAAGACALCAGDPSAFAAGNVAGAAQGQPVSEASAAWSARVRAAAGGLGSTSPEERGRAALELDELLDELARRAATGPVSAEDADLFGRVSLVVSRLADGERPAGRSADELLERAVSVARASGEHGLQAWALLKLGELHVQRGDYAAAREVLVPAAEELERDHATRVQIRLRLAQIAAKLGRPDEALAEVGEAERLLAVVEEAWSYWPDLRADVLATRCSMQLLLGNPDRALQAVSALAELGRARERQDLVALSHVHAARVHLAFGRGQQVVREVERARELGARDVSTLELLHAYGCVAQDDVEIESAGAAALERFVASASMPAGERERARFALAAHRLGAGQLAGAREVLAGARAALDEDSNESVVELVGLEAELALAEVERELERGRAELDPEALDALQARCRETLAAPHARLREAYARFLAGWDRVPRSAGAVGLLHYASRRRMLDALVRITLAVHSDDGDVGPRRAFEELERAQARGSVARSADYEPRGLDAVREVLIGPPEERRGLVTYLPSHGRSHVFAVDAEGIVHAELPAVQDLEPLRRELVAVCSSPPDAVAARAGRDVVRELSAARELARALWPAEVAERAAGWGSVRIAGVEAFGYLPFELLPVEGADVGAPAELLGDRLAVSYLPSVPLGVLLAERARRGAEVARAPREKVRVVLIAANEPPDPVLPTLPLAKPQRASLIGAYQELADVRVFAGEAATRGRLASMDVRDADMLQVLAHGVADFTRERTSGFALADGMLWCEDVERAAVPPIVCLWVCNAGQGPLRRGEDGLATLGDACLAAGAVVVIVSPARIEYRALLELAQAFHARLARGDAPDEALRRARLALATSADRAHPFYSLVHVVGLGDARLPR